MKPETLDVLIWVLIYAGLIGIGLGLSIAPNDAGLGWGVASVSGILAAIGVALVYVRSRVDGERR